MSLHAFFPPTAIWDYQQISSFFSVWIWRWIWLKISKLSPFTICAKCYRWVLQTCTAQVWCNFEWYVGGSSEKNKLTQNYISLNFWSGARCITLYVFKMKKTHTQRQKFACRLCCFMLQYFWIVQTRVLHRFKSETRSKPVTWRNWTCIAKRETWTWQETKPLVIFFKVSRLIYSRFQTHGVVQWSLSK